MQDAVGASAVRPSITPGAVGGAGMWQPEAMLSRPLGAAALPGQQVTPSVPTTVPMTDLRAFLLQHTAVKSPNGLHLCAAHDHLAT